MFKLTWPLTGENVLGQKTITRRQTGLIAFQHHHKTIYNLSNGPSRENPSSLTCSWSQQPAVQVTSSHGEIKHQSPLAVDGVQDVLHCYRGVGVRVLLACLPLHQEVGKGSCSTPLCYRQSLIVVACGKFKRRVLINGWRLTHDLLYQQHEVERM